MKHENCQYKEERRDLIHGIALEGAQSTRPSFFTPTPLLTAAILQSKE